MPKAWRNSIAAPALASSRHYDTIELILSDSAKGLLGFGAKSIHEVLALLVALLGYKLDADFATQPPDDLAFFARDFLAGNQQAETIRNLDACNEQPGALFRNVGDGALAWERTAICFKSRGPIDGVPLMLASVAKHDNWSGLVKNS
jgi:hypothetical protein